MGDYQAEFEKIKSDKVIEKLGNESDVMKNLHKCNKFLRHNPHFIQGNIIDNVFIDNTGFKINTLDKYNQIAIIQYNVARNAYFIKYEDIIDVGGGSGG